MSSYFKGFQLRTVITLKAIGGEIFDSSRSVMLTNYDWQKYLFKLKMNDVKFTEIDDTTILIKQK